MKQYNYFLIMIRFTYLGLLIYLFLGVSLFPVSINCEEMNKSCADAVSDVNREQLRRVDECAKKLNFKSLKEKNEKASCVTKCAFEMAGALDANGYLNVIGMLIFVEENLPLSTHEWTRYIMMLKCFPEATQIDPKEENCRSYAALGTCVVNTFNLVCNPKPF